MQHDLSVLFGARDPYTAIHVVLSLVGIGAGIVVVAGLLRSTRPDGWIAVFLATTAASVVTGFGFPFRRFLPVHAVGIATGVTLATAIFARYGRQVAGPWRIVFVLSAVASLYLNVVVLVSQLFLKVPSLAALAPTLTELPFWIAQGATGLIFAGVALAAVKKFRL
jgi:hypothetical protein